MFRRGGATTIGSSSKGVMTSPSGSTRHVWTMAASICSFRRRSMSSLL